MLVYGPAGSGKTYISERLVGLLTGDVAIPYAIEVGNEVIQVFDPVVHQPVAMEDPREAAWTAAATTTAAGSVPAPSRADGRRAHAADGRSSIRPNPALLSGAAAGESEQRPVHRGRSRRQLVSPQDLMNRWIVPLDRHVDYFALHTGKKFQVPFDVIVRLLLEPAALQARGRGLPAPPGLQDLRRPAAGSGLPPDLHDRCARTTEFRSTRNGYRYVVRELHPRNDKPLLACLPRDILGQLRDFARFNGREPAFSEELLDWAWHNYFASH